MKYLHIEANDMMNGTMQVHVRATSSKNAHPESEGNLFLPLDIDEAGRRTVQALEILFDDEGSCIHHLIQDIATQAYRAGVMHERAKSPFARPVNDLLLVAS